MSLDTELETIRTLSLLSERPHEVQHHGKRYVAFAGYILTYSSFCTIFMWALIGPKIYHHIWIEQGSVPSLRDLNPQDHRLSGIHDDHVGQYVADQFKASMKSMESEEIEEFITGMFAWQPA